MTRQATPERNGAKAPAGDAAREAGQHPAAEFVKLDTSTITRYLLQRGILHAQDIVGGELTVEDISRRNRNFRVRYGTGDGFLVKQLKTVQNIAARRPLVTEAQILRFIATNPAMEEFRPHAPTFVDFDPRNCILIMELIHPATSLQKLNLFYGKLEFPLEASESAGKLLARYHKAGNAAIESGHLAFLQKGRPSGLSCPQPEYLSSEGGVGPKFWYAIKDAKFLGDLEKLRERWGAHEEIVHGDGRWLNYLLGHGEAPDGGLNLRIIDWEMASRGDSVWDVAVYLGEYVRFMLELAGARGYLKHTEVLENLPYALERQHPSAQTFWETYCETRGFNATQRKEALERVMDYLPFYIIQMGYESEKGYFSQGSDTGMKIAHLTTELADRAWSQRKDFMKEWYGIE